MSWIRDLFVGRQQPHWECKTCEVLKEQLVYERAQNQEMLETLTSLLKPVPIIHTTGEGTQPIKPSGKMWSRRRQELERMDKEKAKAMQSPLAAKPDIEVKPPEVVIDNTRKTVSQLELELGVVDSEHIDEPTQEEIH